MRKTQPWLGKFGLAILACGVGVLMLEGGLRILGFQKAAFGAPKGYEQSSPILGYDLSPGFKEGYDVSGAGKIKVWTNELGCFDEPYSGEDGYILLVGDSFAWGYAPFENKWGTLLEQKLDKRVLKCGVGGYGLRQKLEKAKQIIQRTGKSPELIMVQYLQNDLEDDYLYPNATVIEGRRVTFNRFEDFATGTVTSTSPKELERSVEYWERYCVPFQPNHPLLRRANCILRNNSVLFGAIQPSLRRAWTAILGQDAAENAIGGSEDVLPRSEPAYLPVDTYPWLSDAWKKQAENISEFQKLAAGNGSRLVFVLAPTKEQVYDFLAEKLAEGARTGQPFQIIRALLEKSGIPYIDLTDRFREAANQTPRTKIDPNKDLFWAVDSHWNISGNRLAALAVTLEIIRQDLIFLSEDRKSEVEENVLTEMASFRR